MFNYEELNDFTAEMKTILNSYPIRSTHFLINEIFTSSSEVDYSNLPINRFDCYLGNTQYMKEYFWKRWTNTYLNHLTTRTKWQLKKAEVISIKTLVLLKEDNIP
jgi:tRNA(His) 5'-end guanylyltransferase